MIFNYFKTAWRSILNHKIFTLINITGLSIGISAALVIYLIVQYDLTFDKFHPDKDRIYRVVTDFKFSGVPYYNSGVASPLGKAVRDEVTGLSVSAPFYAENGDMRVTIPDGSKQGIKFKKQAGVIYADERYFNLFNYTWLAGSAGMLKEPFKTVLTQKQAKLYFPNLSYAQIVGRELVYADTLTTSIAGIVQDIKENTDLDFQQFISYSTLEKAMTPDTKLYSSRWDNTTSSSQLFIKLNEKTSAQSIEKKLNALKKKYDSKNGSTFNGTQDFRLQPIGDIHFNSLYNNFSNRTANLTTMYGLLAIAAFLLLLGCINFINLTTAQVSQRAKEIGIRKTIGSTRSQLIVQFLTETFLVTLFAVLVSLLIAPLILKLFADFIPAGVTFNVLHKPGMLLFLLLLALVVCFLSGFYPAMVLSGYKPVLVLKNQAFANTGKTRNAWLRKSLTVTQFVIAQFFIMATILVGKQISYSLSKDLGFKKDAIVFMGTPWNARDNTKRFYMADKLRAMPGIDKVSIGSAPPASNSYNTTSVKYKDGKKEIATDLQQKHGDEFYIDIYKIKILAGHNIVHGDTSGAMLINQTYARVLGFKNPADAVGKSISNGDTQLPIIGVVADFYQSSLHSPIKPLAIVSSAKYNNFTIHIALKGDKGAQSWKKTMADVQQLWKDVYPDDDMEYSFVDESIARFYESEQRVSKLLAWSTGLSVFISCLGLLGLAMYTTGLRTKEIGVRKVLGSTVTQIVTMLSTEMIWLVVLAFVIVTPVAWYAMNNWMQNFSERTTISWWIFALSGGGMLLTALLTLSFQTIRAAMANPVKSLRSE